MLRYEDAPDPEPAAGEVLIRPRGRVAQPPRRLGAEGPALRAEAADPRAPTAPASSRRSATDVSGLEHGQRVVINPGVISNGRMQVVGEAMDGTHAELVAIPARNVYPIPDELSFEEAAAFPLVFETAYRMLVTRARLQAGETVFVWGIGGGVATAALAIAKSLGARVIVTSSSEEKLARAPRARRRRDDRPRERGRAGTRQGADGRPRRRRRRRDGRRRDLEDDARGRGAARARSWSAARRPGRILRRACTGSGGRSSTCYGSTMGSAEDFEACLDLVTSGPCPAGDRRGAAARRRPGRARAARGRRSARQDRPAHPGVSGGRREREPPPAPTPIRFVSGRARPECSSGRRCS